MDSIFVKEDSYKGLSDEERKRRRGEEVIPILHEINICEREMRIVATLRNNSLFWGSHTSAERLSVCEYLKKFFMACVDGRTDYERSSLSRLLPTGRKNLTPMMLCQPVK